MGYLIGVLAPGLLVALALGAVAGWSVCGHLLKPRLAKLAERRRQARNAFLRLARDEPSGDATELRAQIARLKTALAERQSEVTEARSEAIRLSARMGARDPELAAARQEAERLAAQLAQLSQAQAAVGEERERLQAEAKTRQWRTRYLEARVRFLEARLAQTAPPPDSQELKARIGELEAALADLSGEADERNRLRWQNRYLAARVKHLEDRAADAPAPPVAAAADAEAAQRGRWRLRYFEARAAHLEARLTQAPPPEAMAALEAQLARLGPLAAQATAAAADSAQLRTTLAAAQAQLNALLEEAAGLDASLAEAKARIAALEAELAARADEAEVQRLRWRARYLAQRVEHLEGRLPIPAAPPREPPAAAEPAPARPLAIERRPQGVAAPRGGLADDLNLISGVTPKIERTLNSLGIYHYEQIAGWSDENVAWIDRFLSFKGRIAKERWVEQAMALARGEEALTSARRHLDGDLY